MAQLLTRRKFLIGLAALGVGGAVYVRWGEPHWLDVSVVPVPLQPARTGRALRVLHLSDFHASSCVSLDFIAHSIELGLAERPDAVVLTGDFITSSWDAMSEYGKILRRLSAAVPTFACLGNHDGGPWVARVGGYRTTDRVRELLRDAGVDCLFNESRRVTIAGRPVRFIGVGDIWSGECRPEVAFRDLPERNGEWRVLLSHNPDTKTLFARYDWDVMLCGHTHGGQLKLPFIGTPFAPVADKRYVEGLHRWENRWLYITRGVGNLHGVRFNCRPQVSVLDFG